MFLEILSGHTGTWDRLSLICLDADIKFLQILTKRHLELWNLSRKLFFSYKSQHKSTLSANSFAICICKQNNYGIVHNIFVLVHEGLEFVSVVTHHQPLWLVTCSKKFRWITHLCLHARILEALFFASKLVHFHLFI